MSLFDSIWHLPLSWFGLNDIPAVPVELEGLLDTAYRLYQRSKAIQPARDGLTNTYTINAVTATGGQFLYGDAADTSAQLALRTLVDAQLSPRSLLTRLQALLSSRGESRSALPQAQAAKSSLQALSLVSPEQFAMSWTNFQGVYDDYADLIPGYAATLADADAATAAFWPTIAEHGTAYNLLILRKAGTADLARLRDWFAPLWSTAWNDAAQRGLLYFIDLSLFAGCPPATVDGFVRFTPATVTLLVQDPASKALQPVAVRVSGHDDAGVQHFVRGSATASAWLYALQAAKASVTVYGIWLGHVYHWHIVTAAMQMTMYNTLNSDHPVYQLVAPQANFLIQFDEILLLLWAQIAPPTSIDTARQFLELSNRFASGRLYFQDDPTATLQEHGITAADFTRQAAWDAYPIAGWLLSLWHETERYVTAFVENTYANDALVAEDRELQAWMRQAADPEEGNIRGLPGMRSRAALVSVLTSLIYRITAHGSSRLKPSAYPTQAFVANFPPCLQMAAIPAPQTEMSTAQLLEYLPKTGTIGQMMTFYNTFIFSEPYVPFIPKTGVETELFFPGGLADPRNQALVAFRKAVIAAMQAYEPDGVQLGQWPRNIET